MSTLTKPYTFTGGSYAVASQVNADLDTLYNWVNGGGAMWNDASVAFTAVPSGPNADPTSGNQLTRKSYVDGRAPANLALNGTGSNKIYVQGAQSSVTISGGSGVFTVNFGTAFPTSCFAAVAASESSSGGGYIAQIQGASLVRTSFSGRLMQSFSTPAVNGTYVIHWVALGA